jgi:hypothetical protein
VAVKCHSGMQNCLLGLPGRILCLTSKKMTSMLLTLLFTCLAFSGLPESSMSFQRPFYGSCSLPRMFV